VSESTGAVVEADRPSGWGAWAVEAFRSRPTGEAARLRPEFLVLAAIVVGQAAWLAVLCSRGWFYTDDFQYMAQSVHHSLDPAYLTSPLNDHLSPGIRLLFWLLTHGIGLHYGPTIIARVILQAIATILLYRLLRLVSPSSRLCLAVTGVYAFSPLLVPGTLWLTTALALQVPQLFTIIAFDAHIRHVRGGSWRWAAACGLALLIAGAFWEKSGITAILLVVLSIGWLRSGSLWRRLWSTLRDWWGWLLSIGPLLGFAVYDVASGHGKSAASLPVHAAFHLVWLQWGHAVWPAVIGGPWRWFSTGTAYQSFAVPGRVVVILGQCAFVGLAAVGWRRNRWAGLFAWLLPLLSTGLGVVLVGVGRYATFKDIVALDYHYAYDVAVPMALAAVLSLSRPPRPAPERVRFPRVRRIGGRGVAVAAAGALAASCLVSVVAWTNRWHQSPAHTYTTAVLRSVRALGPAGTIYNTPVSPRVLPFVEGNRHLADLLSVARVQVHINNGPRPAEIVTDGGQARKALFVDAAVGRGTHNPFCPNLLRGPQPLVIRLHGTVPANEYFLRLTYFQNRPTRILVSMSDQAGNPIAVPGGSLPLDSTIGQTVLGVGYGRPARVTIRDPDAATNTCLSKVELGLPLVAP
jgi:hypothetical protein